MAHIEQLFIFLEIQLLNLFKEVKILRAIQRMYRKNEPDYYILSPYIRIIFLKEFKMCLFRTDTRHSITITASDYDVLNRFINLLQKGISPNELENLLCNMGVNKPGDWIGLCIQEGVIE